MTDRERDYIENTDGDGTKGQRQAEARRRLSAQSQNGGAARQKRNENQQGRPNRKGKRRQRRRRKRYKLLLILLGVLLALVLSVLFLFRVKNLRIEGNDRVTEEEIKTLIKWDDCQGNTLLLWLLNRKVDVSSNDLLSGITVSIRDPQTVQVQVTEEYLVGCVQIGEQYFYVNADGMVIVSQTGRMDDVPLFEGLAVSRAEAGSSLETDSAAVLDDMLHIAQCLREYEVTAETIAMEDDGTYRILSGDIKILLGQDIYMEEKISELKDLMPELEGLAGTLHLEDYDSTKDSIIFTKDS